ncbi:MAG: tandem-95 repeat protein [Bacteroidetes bacterium]|jgi:CshA-type fibril repeat protein|nr:tandem-95 repeat protein [Bacteroidota bacterium]
MDLYFTKIKKTNVPFRLMAFLLLLVTTAFSPAFSQMQESTYTMDGDNAVYSSGLNNGGTVTVPYVLTDGPAIPSLGSSFDVTYTFTDLNLAPTTPSHANFQWLQGGLGPGLDPDGAIGVEPMLNSFTYNNNFNLPNNNKDTAYNFDPNTQSVDNFHRESVADGDWYSLGTFSVTVDPITAPTDYSIVDDQVLWQSVMNQSNENVNPELIRQGIYAYPVGSTPYPDGWAPGTPRSGKAYTTHGATQVFDYSFFDDPNSSVTFGQDGRPLWLAKGSITFRTNRDTDDDNILEVSDLDDDNDGILDVEECAVLGPTGYTATVYDFPNQDTWGIYGGFPGSPPSGGGGSSGTEVATFEYNENVGFNSFNIHWKNDLFVLDSNSPDVDNYQGDEPAVPIFPDEDAAVVFEKVISSPEAGTYTFDLNYGDDHVMVYLNDQKQYEKQFAYTTPPFTNAFTLTVSQGDVLKIVIFEENFENTELRISTQPFDCDYDGDGIPNHLDLDSDNDGCPDAVEGSGRFTAGDLETSLMDGGNSGATSGDHDLPVVDNLGTNVDTDATSSTYGVPIVSPATTAETQGIGESQNESDSSACDNLINPEDDINQTLVDTPVDGNVLTNDSDPEGDDLTVTTTPVNGPTNGTVTLNPDGSYTYTPDPGFTGTDEFTYEVCDDGTPQACETAEVVIDVTGPDTSGLYPPIAQDDNGTMEEGQPVTMNILSNDSDVDGTIDPTTVSLDETSVSGSTCTSTDGEGDCVEVTVPGEGVWTVDETTGEVTFTPEAGFTDDPTPIDYTVADNDGLTDDATITVVTEDPAVNEMTAEDDANSGTAGDTLTGDVLANDIDPDGSDGTPTVSSATAPINADGSYGTLPIGGATEIYGEDPANPGTFIPAGTVTLNADGSYTYESDPSFTGTVNVPYTAFDNDSADNACDTATLYLTSLESTSFTIELTEGPCWRTLSSPVAGETYADFFARFRTDDTNYGGLWTQGATGARFTGGDPNVFTMNSDGTAWVPVSDLSVSIPAGTGVLISVFDEDEYNNSSSSGFPKIAEIDGSDVEHASPVTVNLGTPEGTTSDANGFSMLGNPYKATIDFNELTLNQVAQMAWVYDRNTGDWISWNGTSGDITDGLIAPGQGFLVKNVASPSGTPSLIFPQDSKTTGGTFVGKQQDRPEFVRLEIEGEELYSSMWLEFAEAGYFTKTTGDVIQLQPFESDYSVLSSLKEGQMYDIGRFPSAHEELQIPVIAEVTRAGTYTIRATDMMLPAEAELYLHDLQTGEHVLIADGMEYTFRINQVAKRAENSCFTSPQKAQNTGNNRFVITTASNGIDNPGTYPSEYRLNQNYPNPFNPSTQITYQIPQQSDVRLEVFDMSGRQIVTLVNESVSAGSHTVNFDASSLSSGVYMYRLQAGSTILTKKLTLIK